MRQLHRRGMVLTTSSGEMQVRIERPCDSCSAGCARQLPEISLPGSPAVAAGTQVQVSLTARSLNLNCLSLFGPWLFVVAALIALDVVSVDLSVSAAVALIGGSLALWVGRNLALLCSNTLSVAVVAVDARARENRGRGKTGAPNGRALNNLFRT